MNTKTKSTRTLFASGLLITLGFGCVGNAEQAQNTPEYYSAPVVEVSVLDTTVYQEYIADIRAIKNVEIRTRLKGFLEKIYIDEGAEVTVGQSLFKLNDTEYVTEVARAEAVLENAIADAQTKELEVARTKLFVDKNIVSESDLKVAEAQLSAAQSRIKEARSLLEFAKTQLTYTTIRAPFSGRIDRIPLKEGSLLDEGMLLTSISDLEQVHAYFDISEQEYLNIVTNDSLRTVDFTMPVKLTLANGATYPHEGTAEFAENEFEETTGTISLRALFPNPQTLIKHAASGKVSVPMQSGQNLAVHQKSVFEIQDRTYVYKVLEDDRVAMTPFQAGQRVGHYYIVESGLQLRDKIVFEGTQNLSDGMKISPVTVRTDGGDLIANGR